MFHSEAPPTPAGVLLAVLCTTEKSVTTADLLRVRVRNDRLTPAPILAVTSRLESSSHLVPRPTWGAGSVIPSATDSGSKGSRDPLLSGIWALWRVIPGSASEAKRAQVTVLIQVGQRVLGGGAQGCFQLHVTEARQPNQALRFPCTRR